MNDPGFFPGVIHFYFQIKKVLDKSIRYARHCEWELKNQTVKNDNISQPSLRACEAIQKKYNELLRKLAITVIQLKFGYK
jgi:hypothetical protein